MTREEALKVLIKMRAWRRWGKGEQNEEDRPEMPEQKEVDEAFNVCIEMLSRFSLPSNLDEAAREYLREYNESEFGNGGDDWDDDIFITFKAGAEWMAGQGITKEAVIGMATEEISINVSQQTLDKLDLCPGDKVVVQIRKK